MPKFVTKTSLSDDLFNDDGSTTGLEELLRKSVFSVESKDDKSITFTRGHILGDFSLKVAKLRLVFELPLSKDSSLLVEYGAFAAFDTGDLGKFTNELRTKLSGV